MKTTIKVLLSTLMLTTISLADGDMNNGTRLCGDMNNGTRCSVSSTTPKEEKPIYVNDEKQENSQNPVINWIGEFLSELFN